MNMGWIRDRILAEERKHNRPGMDWARIVEAKILGQMREIINGKENDKSVRTKGLPSTRDEALTANIPDDGESPVDTPRDCSGVVPRTAKEDTTKVLPVDVDYKPSCPVCGEEMVNAVDSITKKISPYLWKTTCGHSKGLLLSIG